MPHSYHYRELINLLEEDGFIIVSNPEKSGFSFVYAYKEVKSSTRLRNILYIEAYFFVQIYRIDFSLLVDSCNIYWNDKPIFGNNERSLSQESKILKIRTELVCSGNIAFKIKTEFDFSLASKKLVENSDLLLKYLSSNRGEQCYFICNKLDEEKNSLIFYRGDQYNNCTNDLLFDTSDGFYSITKTKIQENV